MAEKPVYERLPQAGVKMHYDLNDRRGGIEPSAVVIINGTEVGYLPYTAIDQRFRPGEIGTVQITLIIQTMDGKTRTRGAAH
jgi:hypothetical protein